MEAHEITNNFNFIKMYLFFTNVLNNFIISNTIV